MPVQREYVSRHTYKTPSGQYWRDTPKPHRITNRGGLGAEKNAKRMAARLRDKNGKLTIKRVKGTAQRRGRQAKEKHSGSPTGEEFESDTIYKKDSAYADTYITNQLNTTQSEFWYFNPSELEYVGEGENAPQST